MANDFTIIMAVRHRFGDDIPDRMGEDGVDQNVDFQAPFVGRVGEFPFSCPNVDSSQGAVPTISISRVHTVPYFS
jgi:hypothetical protein